MKNQELYNKLRIVAIVLMVIAIFIGAYKAYTEKNDNTDAKAFSKEYPEVKNDNMFIYKTLKEANNNIESGKGVFFFCTAANEMCHKYAQYLYEEAKDLNYSPVYYIDLKVTKTDELNKLNALVNYSKYPLIVVSDRKVIGTINKEVENWNKEEIESFKIEVMNYINKLNDSVCTDDCN